MNKSLYINNEIKPLTLNSTISKVKKRFKKLIVTHLPIVENDLLIGMINESDIHGNLDGEKTLESIRYIFQNFSTQKDTNWLHLLKIFSNNESNILPILNEHNQYVGYYELSEVLNQFNQTSFLIENGTILMVSIKQSDYSMSKITQIVESNNAKLYGCFIHSFSEYKVTVTLKMESININEIIQTFRRFNFTIENKIKEDAYLDELKNRSNYLVKYLNI